MRCLRCGTYAASQDLCKNARGPRPAAPGASHTCATTVRAGVAGDSAPTPSQGKGKVVTKSKTKVNAPDPNKKKIVKQIKRSQRDKKEKRVATADKSSPDKEFDAPIKVGESQDKQETIVEMLKLVI